MAVARDFALGDSATAWHANDDAARRAATAIPFFDYANAMMRYPFVYSIAWLPLLLTLGQAIRARRILRGKLA